MGAVQLAYQANGFELLRTRKQISQQARAERIAQAVLRDGTVREDRIGCFPVRANLRLPPAARLKSRASLITRANASETTPSQERPAARSASGAMMFITALFDSRESE